MAQITQNFDVKIRVVHPFLTKSLSDSDTTRIAATGTFTFTPQPQVDTAQASLASEGFEQDDALQDKVEKVKGDLLKAIDDISRIEEAIRKKAGHITYNYDPELAENESIANAEEDIFGVASGRITYDMYVATLKFEEKINKFIAHMSMESDGEFSVPA